MTTISNPLVGATIITHKGNSGIVEGLENERVIIRVADIIKSIPLTAIARWELPHPTEADFEDAVGLIDLIDNPIAAQAVRGALSAVFTYPAEKRRLWDMLGIQQREKLSI